MDVARMISYRFGQGHPQCTWPGSNPAGQCYPAGHPIPGSDTRFATYPVDDVHQALVTHGIGGWG